MALIARLLMAATSLLMLFYVVSLLYATAVGDYVEIWDLVDLDPQPFAPHPVGTALALGFVMVFLCGILLTFWQAHLLFRAARQHLFRLLSRGLRRCGYGLAMMWFALYAFVNAVPLAMFMGRVAPSDLEIEWAPVSIETVFLVLAVVMAAIAANLDRAAEIEDENNQFL
jgi:Na+/proline symporter